MIKDYWIKEIQKVKEFEVLGLIEDDEVSSLNKELSNLIDDQFIETATEKGIARREKILKITPFADDTLDSRRFRVMSKWGDGLPYTYRSLNERLTQLCGKGGYTIELNHGEYTLKIKVELTAKRMEQEVNQMVRKMAPANILVTVELRYRQHKELTKYTHRELAAYKHKQLREDVLL